MELSPFQKLVLQGLSITVLGVGLLLKQNWSDARKHNEMIDHWSRLQQRWSRRTREAKIFDPLDD